MAEPTGTATAVFESGLGNDLVITFPEIDPFLWSVEREGETITFTLGEGDDEESKTYETTAIREFIIENFNWNGIVNMMHALEEKSDRLESYTRPNNLKGIAADDDILIIPDEATEAFVYEQAKYAIETKYSEDPEGNIKNIKKYVDGLPKKGFSADVLETTYEDILREDDNSEMSYNGTSFTMPNLETVSEADLYDFLENLSQARNGLWSTENQVTNFISLRRDLQSTSSKHNDTLFLAWKDGTTKKAVQYIGSTEPGDLTHGQLEPQTLTMLLGFHDTSNCTPSGRTRDAYRKTRGSDELYFQSGDTSMNVHYASHGIYKNGLPKGISEYGLENNADGSNYDADEIEAYLTIVGVLKTLSKWGTGSSSSSVPSYKNLQNIGNPLEKTALQGTTDTTKKIEIKQNNEVVKTLMLSSYQSYINSNYASSTKQANAIAILRYHDSSLTEAGLQEKTQAELVTELKKEGVFESVVAVQLEHEFLLKNIDAAPGNGTVAKINRTATEKADAKTKYDETVESAKADNDELTAFFDTWDGNTILSGKPALKTKLKEEFRINKEDYSEDDKVDVGDSAQGGQGINKKVGGWSEGCQVILGGQHFYEFLYLLTQFVSSTNQERWYYTVVDTQNI